jgi:hypothetical protein
LAKKKSEKNDAASVAVSTVCLRREKKLKVRFLNAKSKRSAFSFRHSLFIYRQRKNVKNRKRSERNGFRYFAAQRNVKIATFLQSEPLISTILQDFTVFAPSFEIRSKINKTNALTRRNPEARAQER